MPHISYLKPEHLTRGASEGGSKCGNKISGANFLIVTYSNYGSIMLSFQDMNMGQTTDDKRVTAHIA